MPITVPNSVVYAGISSLELQAKRFRVVKTYDKDPLERLEMHECVSFLGSWLM